MQNLKHLDPWSRKTLAIAARIATCQRRLALSASPGADLLLELMAASTADGADTGNHSLWDQATAIRERFGIDGATQTIAVIDSGIAYDHVALGGGFGPGYRVVGGWDFAEQDSNPYDDGPAGFHGTHVAGILAGNSDGFLGVAPGADLVALRVFNDNGVSKLDWVEQALQWVSQHRNDFSSPITTVNLSLGALIPDDLSDSVRAQLADEFSTLRQEGILVFASAGNQFDNNHPTRLAFPASSPDVEAVGSISNNGLLSSFSQRSQGILVAPGEGISSSVPDHVLGWDGHVDDFSRASGTSMSSPQVAAASVLLREAAIQRGLQWHSEEVLSGLRSTSDVRHDARTGIDYLEINLNRAFDELIGRNLDASDNSSATLDALDSTTNIHESRQLGIVDRNTFQLDASEDCLLVAGKTGILSVVIGDEVILENQAKLSVFDAAEKLLWRGDATAARQIDFEVVAGQSLRLHLEGDSSISATVVNLVTLGGGRLDVIGTNDQDVMRLDLQDSIQIAIDGAHYTFPQSSVRETAIDLGLGRDQLSIVGSSGADKITLHPNFGELQSPTIVIAFQNIESLSIDGNGGVNRAYLYDSSQSDELEMSPGKATLTGVSYNQSLTGFERLFVDATAGGEDRAILFDSVGDDHLAIRHQFTSLRGDGYFLSAIGFERVTAYGGLGGFDQADLYDSPGNDRMSANATQAWISGPDYYAQARSFDAVRGHATQGGNDYATLYASTGADEWLRAADLIQLNNGTGQIRSASGFTNMEGFYAGQSIQFAALSIDLPNSIPELDLRLESAAELRISELLQVSEPSLQSKTFNLPFESIRSVERTALHQVLAAAAEDQLPHLPRTSR